MAFYNQYLLGEPRFDCRRALDALKHGISATQDIKFIDHMAGWYVDFLSNRD